MIRKMALGFVIFLVICGALYLRFHRAKPSLGTAYAGEPEMTLWNSSAQIRSQLTTVGYGEPLEMLQRFGTQIQVRTSSGVVGWTSADQLILPELWQQEKDLAAKTAAAVVEARGHTRVISNLHIEPGRDTPRIRQLKKDIPVELYTREPLIVPVPNNPAVTPPPPVAQPIAADDSSASAATDTNSEPKRVPTVSGPEKLPAVSEPKPEPKKEDWWLVRAHLEDKETVSGWLLGRFVDLEVPDPLPNYASTAGMRIVSWFELNRVPNANGQPRPQYLLLGTSGPEGQACDFTLMRVYTWGKQNGRYETAFVQSDICGKLPLSIFRNASSGDSNFSFTDPGDGSRQSYKMHQTIVRRVTDSAQKGGSH